jgi:hypothetical protein
MTGCLWYGKNEMGLTDIIKISAGCSFKGVVYLTGGFSV